MKIVISSGHGLFIRGASGYIDEVDEARLVVEETAKVLSEMGHSVVTYHDNISDDQNENLNRIVDFHNSNTRDLDVSVHFNAYQTTQGPMGCEVLYVSQTGFEYADKVVDSVCGHVELINRGPKKRTDLFFLNNTEEPAILIETCFVDSQADVNVYKDGFVDICAAIAEGITGQIHAPGPTPPERPERPELPQPPSGVLFQAQGKCSHFGGPSDMGVSPSEGLAFIFDVDEAPHLFLPSQPTGTSGLARRLNPFVSYVACRWDYDVTSKEMLRDSNQRALVKVPGGWQIPAWPADWGPHGDTDRVADLSPGLMEALGITTDDEVEVIYPWPT